MIAWHAQCCCLCFLFCSGARLHSHMIQPENCIISTSAKVTWKSSAQGVQPKVSQTFRTHHFYGHLLYGPGLLYCCYGLLVQKIFIAFQSVHSLDFILYRPAPDTRAVATFMLALRHLSLGGSELLYASY